MTTVVNKRVLKDICDGATNLKQEFGIYIAPEASNMYLVHFILPGPEETPFEGGLYHGMIRLNNNHPLGAPNIYMLTPSGRFETSTHPISASNRGICTTDTSFHPETWTPVKNIESVLKGFVSLMCDKYDGGVGAIKSTDAQIRALAKASLNSIKNDRIVMELFPDLHALVVSDAYVPVKLGELCKSSTPAPAKKVAIKEPESEPKPEPEPESKSKTKSKSKSKPKPKTKAAVAKKTLPKPKTKREVIVESTESESETESETEPTESSEESIEESSESEVEVKPRKKSSSSKTKPKTTTTKPLVKNKKETKDTKGKNSTKTKVNSKDKKAATRTK